MIRSTVSSAVFLTGSRVAGMAAGIILTPLMLRHLGLELMGLYGLLAGILAYCALLDFGTGVAGMRFLTAASSRGGSGEARQIFGTLNCIAGLVALFGLAFSLFVMPMLIPIFKIPPHLHGLARWAVVIVALTFGLNLYKQQINALLNAANKFKQPAIFELTSTFIFVVGMIVLIPRYPYFQVLVYGHLVQTLLALAFDMGYGRMIGYKFRDMAVFRWNQAAFHKLFSFSRNVWLSNLSGIVAFESQRLFLGAMSSLDSVATYHIAGRFTSVQRAIGTGFAKPLMRHATKAHAENRIDELRRQFQRAFVLFSWVQVCIFVMLFCFAERALVFWLGGLKPDGALLLLRLQAAGLFCILLTTVTNSFARAAGVTTAELWSAGTAITSSLIGNYFLILHFDIVGAAIANLLSLALGAAVYTFAVWKSSKIFRGTGVIRGSIFLLPCTLLLALLCGWLNAALPFPDTRIEGLIWLAIAASPPSLFSIGIFWWLLKSRPSQAKP